MMQRAAQLLGVVCCLACCSCRQSTSGGPPGGLPGQAQNPQSARGGESDSIPDPGDGREQNPDLSPGGGPPAVTEEDGIGNELTASAILLKSQSAYDQLKSYRGTIQVTNLLSASQPPETSSARVVFKRPQFIRIEGRTPPVTAGVPSSGTDFVILSDGAEAWDWWGLKQKRQVFTPSTGILDSMEGFSGVSRGASRTLPSILLKASKRTLLLSDRLLAAMAVGAVLEGQESIDGAPCYRVSSKHPSETYTFWVDRESFLLRKLQLERDPKQPIRFMPAMFSGAYSVNLVEHYTIEAINEELDDGLFSPSE